MEKTTIQSNDVTALSESDDSSYDEFLTALGLIHKYLDNAVYCWKEAEENLIDPTYEKRLAFENFLDELNRRLAKPVANETFRIVREVELTQFRLLKRGSTGRKLRNDVFFICLATIILGILLWFTPGLRTAEPGSLWDSITSGRLDGLEISYVALNLILFFGSACYIVVGIITRAFELRPGKRERQIASESIVERRFGEESGVRVKINLDDMLTIDELVKVHKVNLKILKEKAKRFGLTLEKPNV